jgi:hypothetical protein
MSRRRGIHLTVLTLTALALLLGAGGPASAQQKPNILFIMGDDIGWMQPSVYHRGLMVGETPNIDRIANEGAIFMHYYAEQSCTAGRNAFFTGMHPLRTGMIPPQLPGSPSYNWNMLPIGQLLWLKELESYVAFPPMQDPASYNLTQVLEQVRKQAGRHPSE